MDESYTYRRVATTGCEILFNGVVVAWAVDETWAAVIVAKLNNDSCGAVGAGIGIARGGLSPPREQPRRNTLGKERVRR